MCNMFKSVQKCTVFIIISKSYSAFGLNCVNISELFPRRLTLFLVTAAKFLTISETGSAPGTKIARIHYPLLKAPGNLLACS